MSVFIYRQKGSESADDLSDVLGARRVRVFDPSTHSFKRREGRLSIPARRGDVIVSWGESIPPIEGVKVLNGGSLIDKFQSAIRLKEAGVATVEVSRGRPISSTPPDPIPGLWTATRGLVSTCDPTEDVLRNILGNLTRITNALQHPPTPTIWLPRRFNHLGGHDLMHPPTTPDYWSRKETLQREYRVHIFNGKSIKAGQKAGREGMTPHPWIRSYDGGWGINYGGFESTKAMRKIATEAVEALGLQFGAVDLGEKADGSLIVLECNRAPGLDGGSVESYARAIEGVVNEVRGTGTSTQAAR